MPIPVSCPSCSASFKVKDEYAGKRAKCPKCGEPMTIPAADFEMVEEEPAPAPARTAKPVAAKKPKPVVVDDDDDSPKPANKRRTVEDEEDRPKPKRRREAEEDEEEKPKGKRKGAKSAKQKGLPLPLVIGVIAGAVLIGGGILAVAMLSQPPEQAKTPTSTQPPPFQPQPRPGGDGVRPGPSPRPTQPTKPEPKPTPVATLTVGELIPQFAEYEGKWITLKGEMIGSQANPGDVVRMNAPNGVTVYAEPPKEGFGKAFEFMEQVEFVAAVGGTEKQIFILVETLVKRSPAAPPLDVTANALRTDVKADLQAARAKYDGKLLRVTGFPDKQSTPNAVYLAGGHKPSDERQDPVTCMAAPDGKLEFTPGQPVTLTGLGQFAGANKQVFVLNLCRNAQSGSPAPPATGGTYTGPAPAFELTAEAFVNDLGPDWKANAAKYHGKVMKLTGTAQTLIGQNELILRIDADPVTQRRASSLPCFLAADQVGTFAYTKNSVVTIVGTVEIIDKGQSGFMVSLKDCRPAASGGTPGGGTPSNPPSTGAPKPGLAVPTAPVATLTASELAKDHAKYTGKWVVVTGKAKKGMQTKGEFGASWDKVELEQQGTQVTFAGPGGSFFREPLINTGDQVEVWGRVKGLTDDKKKVLVEDCLLQSGAIEVDAITLLNEYAKDQMAADAKYQWKPLKVKGKVQLVFNTRLIQGAVPKNGAVTLSAGDCLDDRTMDVREGDQVVVLTNWLGFGKDDKTGYKQVALMEARLVSHSR